MSCVQRILPCISNSAMQKFVWGRYQRTIHLEGQTLFVNAVCLFVFLTVVDKKNVIFQVYRSTL